MNLLMTAPLYDNRGNVRYIIGAQVDVSGLIEDGRGLDSFERTLNDRSYNQRDNSDTGDTAKKKHLKRLGEFAQMLSLDESSVLGQSTHSRTSSIPDTESVRGSLKGGYGGAKSQREPGRRRILGNEDEEMEGGNMWALSSSGPSGKLPGVYQNVPFPFTSFPGERSRLTVFIIVSPRPAIPVSTHYFRLTRPSHPRPPSVPVPLSNRRPVPRPPWSFRSLRVWRIRHCESHLATSRPLRRQRLYAPRK